MTLRQLRRFLTLHARLLFAWSKPARTRVRRSVSAQFAVRKQKPEEHAYIDSLIVDAEHERKMRAVEDAMHGKR